MILVGPIQLSIFWDSVISPLAGTSYLTTTWIPDQFNFATLLLGHIFLKIAVLTT